MPGLTNATAFANRSQHGLVADLLQTVGVAHVVTVDLHSLQIEGFFHVPVDSLTAVPTLCQALHDRLSPNVVVVSPEVGRVRLASQYAICLGAPVIVLHKRRLSGIETEVSHVIGEVAGRECLIVDDILSTGGTIAESITALLRAGARPRMIVAATHGLFLHGAFEKLNHDAVSEIFCHRYCSHSRKGSLANSDHLDCPCDRRRIAAVPYRRFA